MIAYIKGELTDIEADKIIVESGGIGYNIYVPTSVIMGIGNIGTTVKVYTYLGVKEDSMTLYGFSTKEELKIFRLMIGVSGIGPKGAIGILSSLSTDDLRLAVMSEDDAAIAKAPGIGRKTAMKLIIELKDKLNIDDAVSVNVSSNIIDNTITNDIRSEALQAMVALGYSQSQAAKAVKSADIDDNTTVEDVIKHALKII